MQVWYWFGCGMVWVFACWHNLCVRVGLLIFFLIFVGNLVIKGVWTAFGYWFNLAIDGCLLWPSGILINSNHKKKLKRVMCMCMYMCTAEEQLWELPCSEWVRERERRKGGRERRWEEKARERDREGERKLCKYTYVCKLVGIGS